MRDIFCDNLTIMEISTKNIKNGLEKCGKQIYIRTTKTFKEFKRIRHETDMSISEGTGGGYGFDERSGSCLQCLNSNCE